MENKSIAIFASGSGTNAQNIFETTSTLENIHIKVVITDQKDAGVIKRCQKHSIPYKVISKTGSKKDHEKLILNVLEEFDIDWIFLAGYMRILSNDFLKHFNDTSLNINRVINIHPSLLPNYPGLNSYQRAFDDNVSKSGVTLHAVDGGVDTGPVLIQYEFERKDSDDIDAFISRGMKLEYLAYNKFLNALDKNNINQFLER